MLNTIAHNNIISGTFSEGDISRDRLRFLLMAYSDFSRTEK